MGQSRGLSALLPTIGLCAFFLICYAVKEAVAQNDELCTRLRLFEQAPFESDPTGIALHRSVTLVWLGNFFAFNGSAHFQCDDGGSQASKDLCAWLPRHSSLEFPSSLPFRILNCHGHNIPTPFPIRLPWFESITLSPPDPAGDREIILHVDLGAHTRNAIELSVTPTNGR